jgi:hypothetical protein
MTEPNQRGDEISKQEMAELVANIRAAADSGLPRSEIRKQLQDAGVEADDARQLVNHALAGRARRARRQPSDDSGVPGWVWFIGILVLLNILSVVFDWGWWFY